ncbi:MAG: hypothetical protein IPM26_07800 [Saprospiraceae bacterium]|nr:hypothetical protein [Saprospiraceae bacterium]
MTLGQELSSRISKYFLHTFIHLSICAGCLTIFTFKALDAEVDYCYILFISMATLAYYNLYGLISGSLRPPYLHTIIRHKRMVFFFLLLVICGFGFLFCFTGFFRWLWLCVAAVLSLWYGGLAHGFLPDIHKYPILRTSVIAAVFTVVSLIIPSIYAGLLWLEWWPMAFSRFLFIAVLVMIFDIGGFFQDQSKAILRLPSKYGKTPVKRMAYLCTAVCMMVDIYLAWIFLLSPEAVFALMITYSATLISVYVAKAEKSTEFYLFAIDGLMMLPFIFLFIFSAIL